MPFSVNIDLAVLLLADAVKQVLNEYFAMKFHAFPGCVVIMSTCFRLFVYYDLSLLSVRHGDDVDARSERLCLYASSVVDAAV